MIFQSLTWRFLKRIYLCLKSSVQASFFVGAFASLCDRISSEVKKSLSYAWLDSSVLTERDYRTSCFYNAANRIWRWVLTGSRRVVFCLCKHSENSVFSGLWGGFSYELALACFSGIMFILPHEMWNNFYFVPAVIGFALWLVVRGCSGNHVGFIKPPVSVVIFFLMLAQGALTAAVPADGLRFFLFFAMSLICAFCIQKSLDTREKLVQFIKILLLSVTVAGIIGILQRVRGIAVNPEFVDMRTNQDMPGRVYGTFANPNNFAQLLILFMPFFIPTVLCSGKKWEKGLFALGFCITFVALLMTYSRSAWLGFFASAVLFVLIYDKRWLLPLLLLAVAAVPFLPDAVIHRIFTIGSLEDSSNSYRLYIWQGCFSMLKDVGFTGTGLGPLSFQALYPAYASPVAATAPHSHMLLLQLTLELGILGAGALFVYVLSLIKQAAGSMRYMNRELKCYSAAGISALFGMGVVSLAEYIWFYPRMLFAFWILPGILNAMIQLIKIERIRT